MYTEKNSISVNIKTYMYPHVQTILRNTLHWSCVLYSDCEYNDL